VGKGRQMVARQNAYPQATDSQADDGVYESVIIESTSMSSSPEPVYVAPVATAAPSSDLYIVQKGDILSKIAVRFDTTTKTLISMNNLSNPDVLYVGQELRVPAGSGNATYSVPASSHSSSVKKGGAYVIQKGDSLSAIAVAAGVSLNDLRSLNNIQGDKIFAGETLYIPSYGKVPSTSRKSTPKKKAKAAPPVEPAPAATEAPAPAPMATAPVAGPVGDSASMSVGAVMDHVVYPGETLDDIARQYGVSKSEIMRMNNISDETAIKENQRLRIPLAE
jgi:lysozyme